MLTLAGVLSQKGEVDLFIDKHLGSLKPEEILKKAEKYFNLDLSKVNLKKAPLGAGSRFLSRIFFLRRYNFVFYLTDGSIFLSTAKKSILHLQSPLPNVNRSLWGEVKLLSWKLIIYNSKFTQNNAEENWLRPGMVIYPPVDISQMKPLKKEKIILNVGRLTPYQKDKKQELLISEFLKINKKTKGWTLVVAGSARDEDMDFVEDLRRQAKGAPVEVLPNLSYEELVELFGRASIYWHAKGFGEEDPVKMEHFGITTVEAMASGCVPVVINRGGQVEIVRDNEAGFLWNGLEELEEQTSELIKDEKLREELSKKAIETAKQFSRQRFEEEVLKLIEAGD